MSDNNTDNSDNNNNNNETSDDNVNSKMNRFFTSIRETGETTGNELSRFFGKSVPSTAKKIADPSPFSLSDSVRSLLYSLLVVVVLLLLLVLIVAFTIRSSPTAVTATSLLFSFTWQPLAAVLVVAAVLMGYFGTQQSLAERQKPPTGILFLFYGMLFLLGVVGVVLAYQQTIDNQTQGLLLQHRETFRALAVAVLSLVMVLWLSSFAVNLANSPDTTHTVLNAVFLVSLVLFFYRIFGVRLPPAQEAQRQSLVSLVYYSVLYVPCLVNQGMDYFAANTLGSQAANRVSLGVTVGVLLLSAAWIWHPKVANPWLLQQGGVSVQNKPLPLDEAKVLYNMGTHGKPRMAVSFWFYLDAQAGNTSPAYNKEARILSVAGMPDVWFNGQRNTLKVTWKDPTKTDARPQLLFEASHVPLQRWNHVVLNYDSGQLDLFLNNRLAKSAMGVLPVFSNYGLAVGQDGGLLGDVCNILVFDAPLSETKRQVLYQTGKDRSPPTLL